MYAPKPTRDYLMELIAEGKTNNKALHAQCNTIDDLYYQRHKIEMPAAFATEKKPVRVPTFRTECRGAHSIVTEGGPLFNQVPVILGSESIQTARARSNAIEAAMNAAFSVMEDQQARPVYSRHGKNITRYGASYGELIFLPNKFGPLDDFNKQAPEPEEYLDNPDIGKERAKQREEIRKQLPWPFVWRDHSPKAIQYIAFDDEGISEVIIGVRRKRRQVLDEFRRSVTLDESKKLVKRPESLGQGVEIGSDVAPGTGLGTVDFYTYYNANHVAYMADDVLLQSFEHGYGEVPVFEAIGVDAGGDEPEDRFESIGAPIAGLIPFLDSYATALHNQAMFIGWQSWWISREMDPQAQPAQGADAPPPVIIQPGVANYLPRGAQLHEVPLSSNELLFQQFQLLMTVARDSNTMKPILKGMNPGGSDTPGYLAAQLNDQAMKAHEPALRGLATMYKRGARLMLKIVDKFVKGELYVLGIDPNDRRKKRSKHLSLSAEMIRGYYDLNCSIVVDRPVHDYAAMRIADQLVKDGFLPHRWALENLVKQTNAEDLIDEIYEEQIDRLPEVAQAHADQVIDESGMRGTINRAAAKAGRDVMGPAGVPLNTNDATAAMSGVVPPVVPPPPQNPSMGPDPSGGAAVSGGVPGVMQIPASVSGGIVEP